MSFFDEARTKAGSLQKKLLGPPYDYKGKIKSPGQLGMSDKGTLKTLAKDVGGLIGYAQILATGGGKASKVRGPLGNKFFLKTGAQCKNEKGEDVSRYIYVNNVPKPPFAGLIKGTTTGANALNPYRIMGAFSEGNTPACRKITLEVVDNNNQRRRESNYLTLNDIKYLREGFGYDDDDEYEYDDDDAGEEEIALPDDIYVQTYYACLAVFGTYIVYRLMYKNR